MFWNANGQGKVENLPLTKAQASFLTSYSLILIGLLECISQKFYLISSPVHLIGLYILTISFRNISQLDLLYKELKTSVLKPRQGERKFTEFFCFVTTINWLMEWNW
jgi:hypothetical protein